VRDALDRARDALERFARLNEQFGVRGCYENHAGAEIVGASPWNLWYLLRDLPPEWLGVEFDLRHALIEGWFSWEPAYELLRERIAAVLVKDFTWEVKPGAFPPARPIDVPLGDGVAPFTPLFASLDSDRFDGPVVMHFEYRMDGPGTTASGVAGREIQGTPGSVPGAPRDGFTQAAAHAIGRDLRKLRSIIRSGAV
jgi:sugar phosphate isomerase/epimerase